MTESDVPTLGLGSEQRQMWTQTVMTLAYGVRERRQALGQVAWSDEQTAERRQERTERIADPTVRAMSTDEWTEAVDRRHRRHGGERHTHSGAGWVTVWIGPLNDGRTALLAGAGPTGSTTPTATAAVSCADTPTAMELADELLAGGPDQVDRLHAFATLSARRAAAAADDLTEPDPDRLARTASAVRQVWAGPRYTALAEAIVASPAFPALAWRLHELEERGYAFTDVLGRIDPDRLMGPNVRDPAALAEWFVEQMAPDLRVVNLDADLDADDPAAASSRAASRTPTAGPAPTPHPTPTPHPSPPTPGPASATPAADPAGAAPGAARASAPRVDAAAAAAQDAAVQPLLAAAYPPELVQRLQGSRAYPRLRAYLHQLHQQGRPVAKALGDVPAARLDGARDPASYLHAAVRRHPLAAPLQPSGPDRAAMADLVRAAMPKSVADKVVASTAWPVLARRLETWTADGLPVAGPAVTSLEGELSSARRARLFVEGACTDWQLEVIRDDAMVVVSELVANAVVHAGTGCRVVLRYGARGLTIAVYDYAPDRVLPLRPVAESQRGHGLFMVAALSLHWGLSRGRGEKCVWAFLPGTAAAAYLHTVRSAARDAVRVHLAHGANSPDAATAVERLVAGLGEHHGPQFVQDVADELVVELAEATAAMATEDEHEHEGTYGLLHKRMEQAERENANAPTVKLPVIPGPPPGQG